MRKLTGYIGAMIIVIALMGSILAGYALNINGTSTVMNEYEKVTDVSGLYTHTQEPSYIEYNPASNYIGYNVEQSGTFTINNNSSLVHGLSYKLYKGAAPNCAWNNSQYGSGAFYVNGGVVGYSTTGDQINVSAYFTVMGDTVEAYVWAPDGTSATNEIHINGGRYWSANFTITYSSGTVTFNLIDNGITLSSACNWLLMPNNDGDYVPILNGNTGYYQYNDIYHTGGSLPATPILITEWNGQPVYNLYSITNNISNVWVLVPKTVKYQPTQDIGINYTESNRVNNYPVPGNNETPTTTQTQTINISNLNGITNYYPGNQYDYHVIMYKNDNVGTTTNGIRYSNIGLEMPYKPVTGNQYDMVNYKLSDILTNGATIPANTKSIKIELSSNNQVAYNRNLNQTNVISYCDLNIPCLNDGMFQNTTVPVSHFRNYTMETNNGFGTKDYAIYNIQDNTVTVYSYDGVRKSVLAPENCYIVSPKLSGFDPSNQRLMVYSYEYREPSGGGPYWEITEYYTSNSPGYPYSDSNNYTTNINLTYYIQENPDNKYFDITKGYSIKNNNVSNVIWDNEYSNGNIQLLFRAENTPGTYHNDIIVGNNTISIDYIVNRYYVTLNGGDPVDIGTWRNIILDINMINGELSVIPVRTFNSFTNVETDNTNIFIGDLINPTPTNIIEWAPTTNSLMFNVYSTSVFMNTYGVVMVNPTLNITDYFTNLDNFYQLKISNISVVGQSMTINGITGTVTGNTVTFNDETIQIKDMTITYADGHAYISDSHATIDLGGITDNIISMSGAWYFITDLMRGYTTQKMIYEWDWQDFILDNVQFCIIYIGLALIGLLIARRYCTLTITDYALFLVSIVIALTVQVIA